MGAPTLCCCGGGCNGWSEGGAPATGFGDTSTWGNCIHCDAFQSGEENCCGPPSPQSMRFQANTKWMWSWHRSKQPACVTCMGTNSPEAGGEVTIPSWDCDGGVRQVMYWGGDDDLGEVGSGAWWINGDAIDMTVELDQVAALSDTPAVDDYPPGCCGKYYYGKCDVTGPTKPGLSDNPFGYTSAHFDTITSVSAPYQLEAFGRLALRYGGWSVTGYPDSPPTLYLRASFSLFVCIRGAFNHYLECTNSSMGTNMGTWITNVAQPVGGCSCGNGISLADQIDWSSLWIASPGSSWNYAWDFPEIANHSNTAVYTRFEGPSCTGGPGGNCTGRVRCPEETFTVLGLDACCCCGDASSPPCNAPWGCNGGSPSVAQECNYWSGRKDGPSGGWSYPFLVPGLGGVSTIQTGTNWGIAQTAYDGLPAEGSSWRCTIASGTEACNPTTASPPGCNSGAIIGGFQGGGVPQTGYINQFPACGLTDVQFGIGEQDPYA